MIVDVHAHFMPRALVELLRARTQSPCIDRLPDGAEIRVLPAGNTLPFSDDHADIQRRLGFMDENRIDRQILSMGLLYGIHALPAEDARPMTRAFNDGLGALCAAHGDRFKGIAMLPMDDATAALEEFRRALSELGLIGAILPANGLADRAAAERLRPLFDLAEAEAAHLFIHPGVMPEQLAELRARGRTGGDDPTRPARMALRVQHALAQATVTLCMTDYLTPYSRLSVQIANIGGTLPAVIERMDHAARVRTPDLPLPSAGLGRVYVDTASMGPAAIEAAVASFGAERVLFGTDCPIFRTDWTLDAVRATGIGDIARNKILGANAEALFG